MLVKRLVALNPVLIAVFAFGMAEPSHAAAAPDPANAAARATNVVTAEKRQPVCDRLARELKRECEDGYDRGYASGRTCTRSRGFGMEARTWAFELGYDAGWDRAQARFCSGNKQPA